MADHELPDDERQSDERQSDERQSDERQSDERQSDERQSDERQSDERRDDQPDVELPGDDVDGSDDFIADATGESYDELADRAQAVIDRTNAMEQPGSNPRDAPAATQDHAAIPGSDEGEPMA